MITTNFNLEEKYTKKLQVSVITRVIMIFALTMLLIVAYITRTECHTGALGYLAKNPLFYSIPIFYLIELVFGVCRFDYFILKIVPPKKKHLVYFATSAYFLFLGTFLWTTDSMTFYTFVGIWVIAVMIFVLPVLFLSNLIFDIFVLKNLNKQYRRKRGIHMNKSIEQAIAEAITEWPKSYYLGEDTAATEAEINARVEG